MLLKELTALFAPSGWEDEARDAIRRECEAALKGSGDRVFSDTMGNLYAFKKGTDAGKKHVMLCAHMDEVGFIITGATDEGLLRFARVGGIDPRVLVSKRVKVGKDAIPGVIGCKPVHLMTEDEEKQPPTFDTLSIDIGAASREEAERLCPKGCYATFDSEYVEFGDGFVKAKAIDDRAGCLVLLDILKESAYQGDMTFVFTVQEEVGLRGARIAARRAGADVAIVIDAAVANDMGKVKPHLRSTECGKGASIVHIDRGMIADKPLRELALRAAKERGIPVQPQRLPLGRTDAAAIHLTDAGIPCLSLGIPCRYVHSPASVAKLSDIEAVKRLSLAVLEEI